MYTVLGTVMVDENQAGSGLKGPWSITTVSTVSLLLFMLVVQQRISDSCSVVSTVGMTGTSDEPITPVPVSRFIRRPRTRDLLWEIML